MIGFRDLVVKYARADRPAVDGVSFEARRRRITAVVGPNGSGKSTLVRALIGRVKPTSGTVLIDDAPIVEGERLAVARKVAVVAQNEDHTFPLTVAEYIALGRFPHIGAWHRIELQDRRQMEWATHMANVQDLLSRPMDALSGGERQRVRLARALAQGGEGLVLDEPTAFLDIGHEMVVFEMLMKLAMSGQAVLLVSHNLNLVARYAAHMVLLDAGRVVGSGTPTEVMQAPILERVYGWPMTIAVNPVTDSPQLTPLPTFPTE